MATSASNNVLPEAKSVMDEQEVAGNGEKAVSTTTAKNSAKTPLKAASNKQVKAVVKP